ncbi:MAG TPA: hypothetical protein VMM35_09070, partial [Longimicrobiales bacterium]|nr:hypothetical protein [Longimicrobiales bacterium]
MKRSTTVATLSLLALGLPDGLLAQVGGDLTAFPPVDLYLEVTTSRDGPVLSQTEYDLVTGEYYRF